MSPKIKRLSGRDVVSILNQFGFVFHSQRGTHVKLRRISPDGGKQTLTVPLHDDLDLGTLRAIIRQSARYIPEEQLNSYFYSK